MKTRLFAFDLDGTLLNSKKELSQANITALREMSERGAVVAFASGRLGSSMLQYVPALGFEIAMLTLNGAAVFADSQMHCRIFHSPLDSKFSDYLINYHRNKPFALNYYINDNLYSIDNEHTRQWTGLYYQQTRTQYHMLSTFDSMKSRSPSKIIFVGDPRDLDYQEHYFRQLWGENVYICRTWDYYLEFLDLNANKGSGLEALASAYRIDLNDVIAFGDATNDIPMLQKAGLGIAMKNAHPDVCSAAYKVSEWSNDEDAIAKEWELLKKL
ncbi:MAG TPA: Cof-type HAD-IIB family hydrolase [Chitinispirillaceae bacterium]|nr:Cof-type HAD-IIB family hydrolase [Chitinispirillaceae bacterium]